MKMYSRLAWDGIRKNRRLYVPYLLTGAGAAAIFYILSALSLGPATQLVGGRTISTILDMGSLIIAVFSLLLLFYTNSFLIRRRNREFALYNILGMDKKNISRILAWETAITAGIALTGGVVLGIILSKLAELSLFKIMGGGVTFSFVIPVGAILMTLLLYGAAYVMILLNSLCRLHITDPAQLLRSEAAGEKPPRANWLLAVVGAALLVLAYFMAVGIENPVKAVPAFFMAVILVIVATYMLFISGSVALCKLLQKNKKFYYQKNHFVSISSMTYRMKRNGAGLASICILATMVLVMLSSTACLYTGAEDSLRVRYPRDVSLAAAYSLDDVRSGKFTAESTSRLYQDLSPILKNTEQRDALNYRLISVEGFLGQNGVLNIWENDVMTAAGKECYVILLDAAEYHSIMKSDRQLADDEVLIYSANLQYPHKTFSLKNGITYRVREQLKEFFLPNEAAEALTPTVYVVMPNLEQPAQEILSGANGQSASQLTFSWQYRFNTSLSSEMQIALKNQAATRLQTLIQPDEAHGRNVYCDAVAEGRSIFYATYGGMFFLGIILSVGFSLAALLIIYYKQVSEGYEDQGRFAIMKKVGMTSEDIRRSINSQMLMVFFLPLVLAGLHLAFAFPFIRKLLVLFNISNLPLLLLTTGISFLVFGLLYILAYRMTSNAYYQLVNGKNLEK